MHDRTGNRELQRRVTASAASRRCWQADGSPTGRSRLMLGGLRLSRPEAVRADLSRCHSSSSSTSASIGGAAMFSTRTMAAGYAVPIVALTLPRKSTLSNSNSRLLSTSI